MKVIWRNVKTQEITSKTSQNGLQKPLHNNLTKTNGFVSLQQQNQLNRKPRELKNKNKLQGSGDQPKPICQVCGEGDNLQNLDGCANLLYTCFGVKVTDMSAQICSHCAELITHTHTFRDMIRAAFHTDNPRSIEYESLISIKQNNSEEYVPILNLKVKKRTPLRNTKSRIYVECSVCRGKYLMSSSVSNFVCARCKIKTCEKTAPCVKCKAVVPAASLRSHLAMHTKADLKGRCRLRSMPNNPSKATSFDDAVKKVQKQQKIQCMHCFKFFTQLRLESHLKKDHGDFLCTVCHICGKDMRSKFCLEKHVKNHKRCETFECPFCGKISKSMNAIEKHIAIHS